jgi:hypothetical protein
MRALLYCLFCAALLACGNDDSVHPLAEQSGEVDTFWGDAPDLDTRLTIFESMWTTIAAGHAAFVTTDDVDWDEVYEEYRPQIEEAEGYGRFYQILSEMMGLLQDTHTSIDSALVCETPQTDRPPYFRTHCL